MNQLFRFKAPLLVLLLALPICGFGLVNGIGILGMVLQGERTEARIVRQLPNDDPEHPGGVLLSYQDAQGRSHTAPASVHDDDTPRRAGNSVNILYMPGKPGEPMLDDWSAKLAPTLIPLLVGLPILGMGIYLWRDQARNECGADDEKPARSEAEAAALTASLRDWVGDASPRELQKLLWVLPRHETLRWATRPRPRAWAPRSIQTALMGLVVIGFCVCFCLRALDAMQRGEEVALWCELGTPLASLGASEAPGWAVGLYLLCAPWRYRRRLQGSLYLITSRRTLVLEPLRWSRLGTVVHDWRLSRNMEIVVEEDRRGNGGNLLFDDYQRHGAPGSARLPATHHGFLHLGDLPRARQELQDALDALPRRRK